MKTDEVKQLSDFVKRRIQLIQMQTVEKNQLGSASDAIKSYIQTHINSLAEQLTIMEKYMTNIICNNKPLQQQNTTLQSVTGIATLSASTLMALLPELGQFNPKKIVALVSAAPFNCDSSNRRMKRAIWGGRVDVRNALHMTTFVAIRFNLKIKAYYDRVSEKGKPYKVAVTACMHKLSVILKIIIMMLLLVILFLQKYNCFPSLS